jgi:hypothetical protein
VQQQLAQPVQVLAAVGKPFGHGVALDQVGGVQDDPAGLSLGVHLDCAQSQRV